MPRFICQGYHIAGTSYAIAGRMPEKKTHEYVSVIAKGHYQLTMQALNI